MKNTLKITTILLLAILLFSCKDETECEPAGHCSNPPKLSSKELIFLNTGGTQEVTIDSESYRFDLHYDKEQLNIYENLKITKKQDTTTYRHKDFEIKTCPYKVIVTMSENAGKKRDLYISTNVGNCFTGFHVEQKGE